MGRVHSGNTMTELVDSLLGEMVEEGTISQQDLVQPVHSSGYPDFKSKEQVKRYYLDKPMVGSVAVQKLKDLGIPEDEARDIVRDWPYEK